MLAATVHLAPQPVSKARLAQKGACAAGGQQLVKGRRGKCIAPGRAACPAVRAEATGDAPKSVGSDPSKMTPSLPAALNIDEIMERLPHRFPFLLVRSRSCATMHMCRLEPQGADRLLSCGQVDRIVEYVPGEYAIGIKNVTVCLPPVVFLLRARATLSYSHGHATPLQINDNFFPGHFPTRPLMPGVLQVEAMAQVGGLVMLTPEVGGSKDSFFFGGVDACRFRKPVLPGDTLVMKVELVKLNKRFGVAKMKGQAFVGDKLACEVRGSSPYITHVFSSIQSFSAAGRADHGVGLRLSTRQRSQTPVMRLRWCVTHHLIEDAQASVASAYSSSQHMFRRRRHSLLTKQL